MKANHIIPIMIISAIAGALIGLPAAWAEESQLLDRIVAVVNDEAITQSEVDILLRPIFEELQQELSGQELYEQLQEIRLKLLNQLIEDRLVFQKAKEMGVVVDESEIDARMKEFTERFESPVQMEEVLKEQGMTLNAIRERLRRQAMIRSLHDSEIRSKIVVSPLEVERYYMDHPDEFTEKEKIRVRSITIRKSDEAREKGIKDEIAWQAIMMLRTQITEGADFEKIAKEHSEDVHAEQGGLGDWIQKGEMMAAIDGAIFSLTKGEVSEIIETTMGYHFFRVEDRKEGKKQNLEEVRDAVFNLLYQQKSDELFDAWMNDLKNSAYISIR